MCRNNCNKNPSICAFEYLLHVQNLAMINSDNLAITCEDKTLNNAAAISTSSHKNLHSLFCSLVLLPIIIVIIIIIIVIITIVIIIIIIIIIIIYYCHFSYIFNMNLPFSHMHAMITMICCKTSIDEAEIVSVKRNSYRIY